MTPTFQGQVTDGKLFLDKSPQFKEWLHTLSGKRVEVTVEKQTHKRSNGQNRYYWGVVVQTIAEHTGLDPEEVHDALKQMHSPRWHMKVNHLAGDLKIPTSTTRLDTLQFVEYTEKCRLWANEFLGLNIPLPGEVSV